MVSRRGFLTGTAAVTASAALADVLAFAEQHSGTPQLGWAFASATEAARAIREKQVSSVELTRLMLNRIERYNPKVHAIVTVTADAALERAREADAALASGKIWGPLHGVPVTIKDTFETAGVRTTAGAPFLKDYVPKQDAIAVARLRDAGMVMLGKANTPTMAADWQTYNPLFPTTNNPYDLTRTPGGSTGGGAAAMSAGIGYLTLGSDIGGSIRVPADFCGLFGHKPSLDVIPTAGHIPPPPGTPNIDLQLPVVGPLARSAGDLLLGLQVMGGPPPQDAIAYSWKLPPARKGSIREYRLRYVLEHPLCPVTTAVKQRLQAGVEALRRQGAELEEGFPEGIDVRKQYLTYLDLLAPIELQTYSPEEIAKLKSAKPTPDNIIMLERQRAINMRHADWMRAKGERQMARAAWAQFFRDYDGFLMPVDFVPAFPHDHGPDVWARVLQTPEGPRRYVDQYFWASFATMTGLPATVAPVGMTAEQLPVGIQILGPWLEDATPIFIAQALEKEFGFQPPKGYESS